jgi:putative DNA primase/helicase
MEQNDSDNTARPPKPTAPFDATHIPVALCALNQWVGWQYELVKDKWTKVPINPATRRRAKVSDPSTWSSFDDAQAAYKRSDGRLEGIGFVLTAGDPFCGVDLDECIRGDGSIAPEAQAIIDSIASYTEISPSRQGVKIFIIGRKSGTQCRSRAIPGFKETEVYDNARYFTVTGAHLAGAPLTIEPRQEQIDSLCKRLWPAEPAPSTNGTPQPPDVRLDEDVLIERASNARNGDKFKRLFAGDTSDYDGDDSRADLALCGLLAFWAQGDVAQIDRIFRRSGLMRSKWDAKRGAQSYSQRTIVKALKGKTEFYQPQSGRARFRNADAPMEKHKRRATLMTDVGNAARLVVRHGKGIRYCHTTGVWYIWDGKHWRRDDRGKIVDLCKGTALSILTEAKRAPDDKRDQLLAWFKSSQKRDRLTAMSALAQCDVAVTHDELDVDRFLFNCLNGTLDLRTGQLRPHDPKDLLTKLAPVEYDSDAQCPLFDRFIQQTFCGDAELIDFVMRWHGHCLTGDVREQIMPIYHGKGNNGKNVLLDTISAVMGPYAGEAPPDLLTVRKHPEHPTEIADLFGMRLAVGSETERDAELRLQLIKRLTGNARLKGRFMRQDYFEFDRTHKLILVTNNKPQIKEDNEAVWRRLRLVPFKYTVPEPDRDASLPLKLRVESSGILAWLVRGCLRWQQSGLPVSTAVNMATQDFREQANSFLAFVRGCCELDSAARCRTADLHETYSEWCTHQGLHPQDPQCTAQILTDNGCFSRKFRGQWHWFGIGLKTDPIGHSGHGGRESLIERPCTPHEGHNGQSTSTMSTVSTSPVS